MNLVIVESPTKVTAHIPSRIAARLMGAIPPLHYFQKTSEFASRYGRDPRPLHARFAREVAGQKLLP